jgi:hypothetical protein
MINQEGSVNRLKSERETNLIKDLELQRAKFKAVAYKVDKVLSSLKDTVSYAYVDPHDLKNDIAELQSVYEDLKSFSEHERQ